MRKALAKEQEDHAITKKANKALKKKYCDLDKKHFFGIATHVVLRQRKHLLPPLVKVVKNILILI